MSDDSDTPIYDKLTGGQPGALADPPEFDRSLVPDDARADLFFDGETGRGLTNLEWDIQRARLQNAGCDPFEED